MIGEGKQSGRALIIKRIIDIIGGLFGLIVLSPALVSIAVLIKRETPGNVLFIQERIGKEGRPFKLYKFRTMLPDADKKTLGKYISEDEEYITHTGSILRKWALDELPQLINVLMGDMSMIGPRPTLAYQVEKYNSRQKKRLLVKPGLTGWAQVNGRNKLNWPERIELDVWYVENWSLWLDLKIMLRTPFVLIKGEGAFSSGDMADDIVREN